MQNQNSDLIIQEFLKRPIAYHPIIAKAFGSAKLAILWSQIYYWSDKTKNKDGWIYKTQKDIYDETGLARKEQETARKIGNKLGVMESKRMGSPCTVHFRINMAKVCDMIGKWVDENVKDDYLGVQGLRSETVQGKDLSAKILLSIEINSIFNFWNEQKIVNHRKLDNKTSSKISSALKEYTEDEIKQSIEKYGKVINGEGFFWTYRWTLIDFLQRGLVRFLETPIENFKKREKPKIIKKFYRGDEIIEKYGKLFVIHKGDWLEFAGKKEDIIEKEV